MLNFAVSVQHRGESSFSIIEKTFILQPLDAWSGSSYDAFTCIHAHCVLDKTTEWPAETTVF